MKNYTEVLQEKLNQVKQHWSWKLMSREFALTENEQLLLCALWELPKELGKELSHEEFASLYQKLFQDTSFGMKLPEWIYEVENKIILAPVVKCWLDGEIPVLPVGCSFTIPAVKKSYGLDTVLADAKVIFENTGKMDSPAILCIEGEKGSGRSFCMEQICANQDLALITIDAEMFQGKDRELNALVLCAKLYGAFVCVKLEAQTKEQLIRNLCACFQFYGVIKNDHRELQEQPDAVVFTRKLDRPNRMLKQQIVEELMGDCLNQLTDKVQKTQLVGRQLPMGSFLRYLKNVRAELNAGTFCMERMQAAAVSSSLNFLPSTRTFDELKLPKVQYEQLQKISKMIAARESVMTRWGFGNKFSYGNGMTVLFYGAPGTGKTMAAQVLANALGMPLYRVDLSQLISKYIGETQKNIGRIFDEAEKCDCILLFDEADAIFSKRSDVSDAQDRYSNAETAYLLQRIEQYTGVSILATNLLQNFDDAFRRRISYMVHFPMPDVELRKELWESIFPKETPVAKEVDALMLAQAFELSGASIKNAALHGALLAGAENCEVRMRHILDGIRNEYGKQGKSFSSSQKELIDAFQ